MCWISYFHEEPHLQVSQVTNSTWVWPPKVGLGILVLHWVFFLFPIAIIFLYNDIRKKNETKSPHWIIYDIQAINSDIDNTTIKFCITFFKNIEDHQQHLEACNFKLHFQHFRVKEGSQQSLIMRLKPPWTLHHLP